MQPNGSSAFPHIAFLASVFVSFGVCTVQAQTSSSPPVTLVGNHPAAVATLRPVAHADLTSQLKMEVTLALRNRHALDRLLQDQQDPASPQYHKWLTPEEFSARFGPSQQDADAVAQWLNAQGFQVTETSVAERYVRFTGRVADAERTFATDIMAFGDGTSFLNTTDPMIPAHFAGVIGAIHGLNNLFHWQALNHGSSAPAGEALSRSRWSAGPLALLSRPAAEEPALPSAIAPRPQAIVDSFEAFGPSDFYSFYNESPLLTGGINGGGGDCIAIVGDSDYLRSALRTFNSQFGLTASSPTTILADGTNPGVNNDETETLLDLEWSHAVAPGTPIRYYLGNPSTSIDPIVDALNAAVTQNQCGVISISFGSCGGPATLYTVTLHDIYRNAAAQGQTVFVSSGDTGAAGLVPSGGMCVTGTSRNVNELGTDPNVTEVGGTGFTPVYDSSGNNVGEVPESVYNDGWAGGATGGGESIYFTKPSYQKGLGVPADGRRDVPDVALFASPNSPAAFIAYDQSCGPALNTCSGAGPVAFIPIGGTSLSNVSWAAIAKLIAQLDTGRLGAFNPKVYALANEGQAAAGFRDVTTGNNDFNGVTGFDANVGFDLTTGWGTVDIASFANKFVGGSSPTPTPTTTPTSAPTATPNPTPTAAPSPTASPVRPLSSSSNSNGGGSTVWLVFFGLALGWSVFQLLKEHVVGAR